MNEKSSRNENASIRRHLVGGTVLAFLLVGGLGGWASTTELSGAVIAPGSVVVESNVKKVQHLTGGVIKDLLVDEGANVRAGDVVVRLDDTVVRANLAVVVKALDEVQARKARLESERDGAQTVVSPDELLSRSHEPDVARAIDSERRLFELRRAARVGQKSQLRQRIAQLEEEMRGHVALQEAKAEEIEFIRRELEGVRELWAKNLIQMNRLTALEREAARLKGERAQSIFALAQSRGKASEIELQIIQIDQDLGSEVAKDLREADAKIGELVERKVAAEDQLQHVDIRAPQDGIVLQLAVHTVGGVVSPGDTLMLVVPSADLLTVAAKIAPQDIDQLYLGQLADLRFTAFNQRTTPEISGILSRISADVSTDQRTGRDYYTVQVTMRSEEVERLGHVKLAPGMPVEVFIRTAKRNVTSYFIKPLHDQLARAFRER
jgi:HlyD family secretion protein